MDDLIFNIRLLLLAWLHHRSRPGPLSFVKCLSYKEIKRATDDFRRVIDNSPYGSTYIAKFQNGNVALVKEMKILTGQDDGFYKEVQLLGRLHHRHVVALNGYCLSHKRFLLFENVENGSLKKHLNDPLKTPLNWRTRLQIAVGIAAALEYLHFFCEPPVYHVTVSSSNIMLDENFTAKLHLSNVHLINTGRDETALMQSSNECMHQTQRSIMFQLGLLILELITGQSPDEGGVDLIQWIQESNISKSIHYMIDPDLGDGYNSRELKALLNIAKLCIKSVDKPPIFFPQILWYLQKKVAIP